MTKTRKTRATEELRRILASGNYSTAQLVKSLPLFSWSHAGRFRHARRLLARRAGASLLDYGCGDGTFLALSRDLFAQAAGYDASREQVSANRERFKNVEGVEFFAPEELANESRRFDVVTCMEVLEHCTDEACAKVLSDLGRLVAPDGVLLVSVPIEIGPPLLVKQAARRAAAILGLGYYRHMETYSGAELWASLVADSRSALSRPTYEQAASSGTSPHYHGHKGFNWRALRERLSARFELVAESFSPLPVGGALGALVSSQVFFLLKPRAGR